MRHDSENEDDPEPYESSGDEWNEKSQIIADQCNRRRSTRNAWKKKIADVVIENDGNNDDDDDDEKLEVNFGLKADSMIQPKTQNPGRQCGTTKKKRISNNKQQPKRVKRVKTENTMNNKKKVIPKEEDSEDNNDDEEDDDNDIDDEDNDDSSSAKKIKKILPRTIQCTTQYSSGSFIVTKKDAQENDPKQKSTIWRIDGKALLQKYEPFEKDEKILHHSTPIFAGWSPMEQDLYYPLTVDLIGYEGKKLIVSAHWDKVVTATTDSD